MEIKLSLTIIQSEKIFTGWINTIPGIAAQGESLDEVKNKLFKLLRIKWEVEEERMPVIDANLASRDELTLIPA